MSLVSLTGCSNTKPITITKIEYKYIPSSLLYIDCQAIGAGETVRSLVTGYINNTTCLNAHMRLIEGLKLQYTKPN